MSSFNQVASNNPLLQPFTAPNQAPPFDKIKEEHYLPAIEQGLKEARANIAAIKANPDKPDFENTIVALESASETLEIVASIFYEQMGMNQTAGMKALVDQISPKISTFSTEVALDSDLFQRIKAVHDNTQGRAALNKEQNYLLDKMYTDYVKSGVLLPDGPAKDRFKQISEELSTLGSKFTSNVTDATDAFEFYTKDTNDLAGLPQEMIDGARDAATVKGRTGEYFLGLSGATYTAILQNAENRAVRKTFYEAWSNRGWGGPFDNSVLLTDIHRLEQEKALILGYPSHAHLTLEDRMAQTPQTVFDFLDKLKKAYKPAAQKELGQLRQEAAQDGITDIKPWDTSYYAQKLQKKLYGFSDKDIRPYLPAEKVIEGTFAHFARQLDLEFRENPAYPVWHEDVKAYDVIDKDGTFQFTLYTDLYERKGKAGGAHANTYREQGLYKGKMERPVVTVVCNFEKPTQTTPSQLTHREVETLFHEFGHAVHAGLSDSPYKAQSSFHIPWDAVELPSQFQENYAHEAQVLKEISGHHQTGEPLPDDLIAKMQKASTFLAASAGLRQVSLATLDMSVYTTQPQDIGDIAKFEKMVTQDVTLLEREAGPTAASFSHIFAGGYGAGYYSYKWAEVLDADAYEFMNEGTGNPYDPVKCAKYKQMLKDGAQRPMAESYRSFRGCDADPDALPRREGLLPAKAASAAPAAQQGKKPGTPGMAP